jgi:hypothetical protein
VRPLYASNISVSILGSVFIVTFENASAMTSVRISKSTARELIRDLEAKLTLPE